MKLLNHTPGPWEVNTPGSIRQGGRLLLLSYKAPHHDRKTPPLAERQANAKIIAAAPTMFGKLADTVAWLDREVEDIKECSPSKGTPVRAERLEELRDDLAETLRKITEGT